MDTTYTLERIDAIKAQIAAYEAAIIAIVSKGEKSYTLDTGQTRTTVTMQNISDIRRTYEELLSLLSTLCNRVYGSGGQMRPGW